MTIVELQYGVIFGKGDASDWITWNAELDDEEEKAYLRAKKLRKSLNECDDLQSVLDRAYEDIEQEEIQNMLDYDDEYVQECVGMIEVDPDEINDLVASRDPHTMEFFELTDLTDEELEEWDAYDLDSLPMVCDFEEDYEPGSPFESGWRLNVEFAETPDEEDLSEEEAQQTLTELFREAKSDYSIINDYVQRCEYIYDGEGDLQQLAFRIAGSMGINDYMGINNQ